MMDYFCKTTLVKENPKVPIVYTVDTYSRSLFRDSERLKATRWSHASAMRHLFHHFCFRLPLLSVYSSHLGFHSLTHSLTPSLSPFPLSPSPLFPSSSLHPSPPLYLPLSPPHPLHFLPLSLPSPFLSSSLSLSPPLFLSSPQFSSLVTEVGDGKTLKTIH